MNLCAEAMRSNIVNSPVLNSLDLDLNVHNKGLFASRCFKYYETYQLRNLKIIASKCPFHNDNWDELFLRRFANSHPLNLILPSNFLELLNDLRALTVIRNNWKKAASGKKLYNLSLHMPLKRIPAQIQKLTHIKSVSIYGNFLTSLVRLRLLTNLRSLTINSNPSFELAGLGQLTSLSHVAIMFGEYSSIDSLPKLTRLQRMSLLSNELTSIEPLSTLTGLRHLNVGMNKLTSVRGIASLVSLRTLALSENQLTSLDGLGALVHLHELIVTHNRLTSLRGIESLTSLKTLYIGENPLTSLDELAPLKCLESIFAYEVDLVRLPPVLPKLSYFLLGNNSRISAEELRAYSAACKALRSNGSVWRSFETLFDGMSS